MASNQVNLVSMAVACDRYGSLHWMWDPSNDGLCTTSSLLGPLQDYPWVDLRWCHDLHMSQSTSFNQTFGTS